MKNIFEIIIQKMDFYKISVLPLFICFFLLINFTYGSDFNTYKPQNENPFNEKWRWQTFPELVGKGCRSMVEEKNGNLWFGVSGGVYRYDGLSWRLFKIGTDSIDFSIVTLFASSSGTIYAGSTQGIYIYSENKWSKINIDLDFGDPIVYPYNRIPIIEGSDHSIWIGTKQGAIRIKDNKIALYRNEKIISDIKKVDKSNLFDIYSIAEDLNGNILFGLRDGKVYKFCPECDLQNSSATWLRIDNQPNYIKFRLPLIKIKRNGNIYVASSENDGGINIYKDKKWIHVRFKDKYQFDDLFSDIIELNDGKICIGGIGRIFIGEMLDWKMYESPNLPFASNRLILYQSRDKGLWIIGLNNEVWKIDLSTYNWETYIGLNFQTEDNDNNYWFISFEGKIVRYNTITKKWQKFELIDGVIDFPLILITTKDGHVWAAGSHNKICATSFFNGTKWEKQLLPSLGWSIDRRAAFEALDGSLWFGSSSDINTDKGQKGGLVRYIKPELNNYSHIEYEYHFPNKKLELTGVYGIGQTNDSTIWTGQLGLYTYSKKRSWDRISKPKRLQESFIDCLDITPNGDLWVGTRTEGVYRFNNNENTWQRFTVENGLSSNTIVYIFAENDNSIWIVTDKDILHYDGNNWTKGVFSNYFKIARDGISIHRTKDGSLWINQNPPIWYRQALYKEKISSNLREKFKTIKHFPDNIAPDTKVTFYLEKISQPGNVIISWSGTDPWKSTSSSLLDYSYRIDKNKWSQFGKKTNNIFLALDNGNHIFQVKARDSDFNVDLTPAAITFYVIPPVWKQTWFIFLIFSFLSIISFFIIYLYHRNKIIKEISETKVKLFANISHELRTPLTLITGPLLKVLDSPQLSDELRGPLNRINRNTNRLLRLVNQILDFRKMEAKQLKFNPEFGDIIDFLKEEVFVFLEAVKSKNINLTFEPYTDSLNLLFDHDKIEKIIFNLISNAVKFTPANGSIKVIINKISSKKIKKVSFADQKIKFDNWLQIIISDTGIGISKSNIEKIFKRFYQVQDKKHTSVGGTGIGLSVTKELVNVHFGEISVESIEDKGTSFTILIPFLIEEMLGEKFISDETPTSESNTTFLNEHKSDGKLQELSENYSEHADKCKILIVEDNDDMRSYINEELQNDYNILEASNGNQGFDIALNETPELILSDIMMPHTDGIQFCKKIKTDERTSHIAVILLTAKSSMESKIEGLETGADDYITKPFYIDELRLRINNIIDSRRKFKEQFARTLDLKPSDIQITSFDEKFIKNAINIIEENIDDSEFSVEKFSQLIGMSRVSLYSKLKTLTNHSVQEFIFLIKLKRAAQLLRESGKTVTEITYDVGFKDPSHFSKLFKKQFGQSPKSYMNEHNKK